MTTAGPDVKRSRTYYRVAASVATIVGALCLIYVWNITSTTSEESRPNEQVIIAASGSIAFCPLLVAKQNGYLSSEGVTADFRFFGDGNLALNQVVDGHADLAIIGEIPIMYAVMDKKPVSILATMTTMADHVILGRRDRGVRTPSDLKGKRIGISIGNTTHFFVDEFFLREGLSRNDYIATDMKPAELLESIVRGDIDAIATYQPRASVAAATIGSNAVIFSVDTVYDTAVSLVATRDYAGRHMTTLQKLLKAAIRGARFCKDSPDEAIRTITPVTTVSPTLLKDYWHLYHFELTLRQGLLLTLEDEGRWAIRNGSTNATTLPNFLDHFEIDPLKSVSPLAVTIIH